jgi:hypothetical protein
MSIEKTWYNTLPNKVSATREAGEYLEDLETFRTTRSGLEIFLRPVKLSDASYLSDFFNSLSDQSFHYRFNSERKDIPPERLQKFTVVDYSREMFILALIKGDILFCVFFGSTKARLLRQNLKAVTYALRFAIV